MNMAELQTVAAAFDAARLAWSACIFLKKVKDAAKMAVELHERVESLHQVLDGIGRVLKKRKGKSVGPYDTADVHIEDNIHACITASRTILANIESKVGGFHTKIAGTALVEKVRLAVRQPGIIKLQTDLEARTSALQTYLSLLQL